MVQRERLLTGEIGRIDALLIVKDDGYEVIFKAGVTVEVEI